MDLQICPPWGSSFYFICNFNSKHTINPLPETIPIRTQARTQPSSHLSFFLLPHLHLHFRSEYPLFLALNYLTSIPSQSTIPYLYPPMTILLSCTHTLTPYPLFTTLQDTPPILPYSGVGGWGCADVVEWLFFGEDHSV